MPAVKEPEHRPELRAFNKAWDSNWENLEYWTQCVGIETGTVNNRFNLKRSIKKKYFSFLLT